MNNKLSCALAFILGAGVGSVVAWWLLKTKYEQILEEELEAMEEYYSNKKDLPVFEVKEGSVPTEEERDEIRKYSNGLNVSKAHLTEKPDIQELVAELEKHGYSNLKPTENTDTDDEQLEFSLVDFDSKGNIKRALQVSNRDGAELIFEEKEEDILQSEPYVITPEEFGELEDYNTVSLTYYADHILTYEDDEIVEDVDGLVGEESLTHFGEYEDDSVFVRNDVCKTDYEILLDDREFMDVHDSTLYPGDDE